MATALGVLGLAALRITSLRKKWRSEIKADPKTRKGGYIYFFFGRWELPFFIKIGRAIDVDQRMRQHKTSASPFGVYVVAVVKVKNDRFAETFIHKKFARWHIDTPTNGDEWYWFAPAIWLYALLIQDYPLTKTTRKKF
jgi:hypothetical protein